MGVGKMDETAQLSDISLTSNEESVDGGSDAMPDGGVEVWRECARRDKEVSKSVSDKAEWRVVIVIILRERAGNGSRSGVLMGLCTHSSVHLSFSPLNAHHDFSSSSFFDPCVYGARW